MADVVSTVAAFFKAKGLPNAAIAAILGNMQVESGFNTSALNGGEGAIGLAQWEGGRRTALQQYASSHGMKETDLNAQLGYMWQELNQSYGGVLQQMKTATDPGQAAAIWDSQYEVSSGSSRGQRVANAQAFAQNGFTGGPAAPTGAGQNIPESVGATALAGGATAVALTPEQKKQALQEGAGALYTLATSVPELSSILNKAISLGWTATEFQNAITNTAWYKTHSDTVRSNIVQKVSDPATYAANQATQGKKIQQVASQMGVYLSTPTLNSLINHSMMEGWTDQSIQNAVGASWSAGSPLQGQAATTEQLLKQQAAAYGVPLSGASLNYWTMQVLSGKQTTDSFKQGMADTAKGMYPGLAAQIDSGLDVKTIADPYVQTKANLLEVNPNTIDWTKDLTIKQALQGTAGAVKGQAPTATPLWQFEKQVKQDPKWQQTLNAHQATSSTLMNLGKAFGFEA